MFILALSTMMTAGMPPAQIWETRGEFATFAECEIAWDALGSMKQHAKCFTADQLAEARKPVYLPVTARP